LTPCCSTEAIASQFDQDTANEELRRYRRDGPVPTTQALIDALVARGVADAEVLDIGAGIGAIHHALLERGARRAVHVDISNDYLEAARLEADRLGHAVRVRFVRGNFVDLAPKIDVADVVTLDRVICCYPDLEGLVTRSAERARRLYGAVFPRDRTLVRLGIVFMNLAKRLRGSAFRSYFHSPALIDEMLLRAGLVRQNTQRTWFWEVVVYTRRSSPALPGGSA
jgi:2-polyprenyl-3-methyl-5-hydroxy-6-metoxy-1,4-benzoquinol methylase